MSNYDYNALVNEVVRRGINMFESFDDWTKGALALADLGEDGRCLFKAISSLSDKYRESENDYKFSHALRTRGSISIASFIYMCKCHNIDTTKFYVKDSVPLVQDFPKVIKREPINTACIEIPKEHMRKSLVGNMDSDFVCFLKTLVEDIDRVAEIIQDYQVGATPDHHVIYWYMDQEGLVRYGKIMAYDKNGHREHSFFPKSIPCELAKQGQLPSSYTIKKTLFGEHLLAKPENHAKTVGIVESEKSAIICSLCMPDILWMATGSMNNMQQERFEAVKNRKVILYPDTDEKSEAFKRWDAKAKELNMAGWNIHTSNYLEMMATPDQRKQKIDIADLLIYDLQNRKLNTSKVGWHR